MSVCGSGNDQASEVLSWGGKLEATESQYGLGIGSHGTALGLQGISLGWPWVAHLLDKPQELQQSETDRWFISKLQKMGWKSPCVRFLKLNQ